MKDWFIYFLFLPIQVDKATAKKQRLDFSWINVEIPARDELLVEVCVRVNGESVLVELEYQWLPSKCTDCKVFGHHVDFHNQTNRFK